jgi:hypothetical protein
MDATLTGLRSGGVPRRSCNDGRLAGTAELLSEECGARGLRADDPRYVSLRQPRHRNREGGRR